MFKDLKELFRLLNQRQRLKVYALQGLFFISALAQIATIGSIAPFIAVITAPDLIHSHPVYAAIYDFSGATDFQQFLILYAALVCVVIFCGNAISAIVIWFSFRVSVSIGSQLQRRLFNLYMSNQFIYFMKNSPGYMINKINGQIPRMIYMVMQPSMQLISQFLVVFLIILTLFLVDPMLSIISGAVVGAVYYVIYLTVRRKTVEAGVIVTDVNRKKLDILQQSIRGIRDVKLMHVEDWYETRLDRTTRRGLNANSYISLAGDLPRYIVETIIFLAIIGLALYLLLTEGSGASVVSTLGFYAMAGYKILPAAQTIYKSITTLKGHGKVVWDVSNEFDDASKLSMEKKSSPSGKLLLNKSLVVDHINFSYPGEKAPAIKDLSMTIKANTLVAFVGGSGAGKSTVANLICGLITVNEGSIFIDDKPLKGDNVKSWQHSIGYVPQNIFLINDTITKNITFGIKDSDIDLERVKEAAKRANIDEFIETLSDGYDTVIGENGDLLSGGQRQRLAIARALYRQPSILIMDEATSALDNITERNILKEIGSLSKSMTIIMIAHRLSTVEKCDDIFILEDGSVSCHGTYEELLQTSEYFRELVYGDEELS
ncbi:ABC transporter ATP-binding protein [Alteromonas pelagimontana]|uniref:ABC transporter ATP-binding protein n=1 Tax=Alteromonas pelagimontana TaxID=1858656 RepID=A0A6M4MGA2_9ALTE|nr:ABC transporter ATP-binding protein [Alteromonas pelagimontana]QJR81977.1 ABC transporter ATP-binding protein [Alteromonas pelagimontana]